ncbi:hypothetical protein ACFFSY_01405 [Paenibacillus aurantiacus]|uniref:SRPBCC family protein n=1 Tax=Paenibacillus aurantiacus TaxID=1936118 RepID=A0ABV5KH90_9BACL
MTLEEVKAGLEPTARRSVTLTDQPHIHAIIDTLRHRTVIRTMNRPSWIPVGSNPNDRLELTISLVSEKNEVLEYRVTSEGHVEVRKGSDTFANAFVIRGSAASWFEALSERFDELAAGRNAA